MKSFAGRRTSLSGVSPDATDTPEGQPIRHRSSMRDLYDRLKERGFDPSYLRSFVLPEWWTDDMADTEANRALAEAFIAKQLGFSVQELRKPTRSLTLPSLTQLRFKRYKGQVDDKVRASALVAQRAAQAALRAMSDRLPPFQGSRTAVAIREEILRRSQYVGLDSLLSYCWESGIPVIRLTHVPASGKRFDGMATFVGDRPLIVLASGRDAPPWLAFHLAHELGHIVMGHVRPGGSGVIDWKLETETGRGADERSSDRFACEVLTGSPAPKIRDLRATAPRLAVIAASSGPKEGIDPGVLALIYGRSNNRWAVAQSALKHLERDAGGQAAVSKHLDRYLADATVSEADERLLQVLKAA
jgi:hypothetical protein